MRGGVGPSADGESGGGMTRSGTVRPDAGNGAGPTTADARARPGGGERQTLRRPFPGRSDEAIAERLIRNAALTTAAVGATSGGVAAIEWVATPTLLSAPVLLAAETVVVVALEIKLIGELHEVYGAPV